MFSRQNSILFLTIFCLFEVKFNCLISIRYGQTVLNNQNAMNSNNVNSEKQMEKQIEKRIEKRMKKEIEERFMESNQVNLFVI